MCEHAAQSTFTKSVGTRSSILAAYSGTISSLVFSLRSNGDHEPGRRVNRGLSLALSGVRSRLCGFLELLKPDRQSVAIRTILSSPWQFNHLPDDPLEAEFEERAIVDFEQTIGDVNLVIGVDVDQVGIEGGMMDFGPARGPWSLTGRGTAPRHRKGMGIEVGIKARLRIMHRSEMPS